MSKFVRNVAMVVMGTAGGQVITMAFTPIITRLYGPEAFGLLSTFTALTTVLTPIAALTYPIAITLPEHDSHARGIVKLSIYITFGMAGLIAFIVLVFGDWLVNSLKLHTIGSYILLVPLVALFGGFLQIAQQWLIRYKLFTITARAAVFHSLLINSLKSAVGLFHPVALSLVIIASLSGGFHAALLSLGIKRSSGARGSEAINHEVPVPLVELAIRYKHFPLFRAPQAFLNPLSYSLPVLMLAGFFGPASVGFYGLTRSVLSVPANMIGTAVGNVIYPKLAEASNEGKRVAPILIKATLGLAAIGLVPFGLVIAFGPSLFAMVFGSEWGLAGEYARWVALSMFFGFINRPCNVALPVLSLLPFFLAFEIVNLVLRVTAIAIGFYFFRSDVISIALFCLVGVVMNIILIVVGIVKAYLNDIEGKIIKLIK